MHNKFVECEVVEGGIPGHHIHRATLTFSEKNERGYMGVWRVLQAEVERYAQLMVRPFHTTEKTWPVGELKEIRQTAPGVWYVEIEE